MKRSSRLFALAEALRARRTGVTAEGLAERFGVSVRTIYRDLDALGDAGLPLIAERGRGGGYALERGYSLPPVNFTPREAAVLVALGRWARELRVLPFVETLARALEKVRGALSASAQRELIERAEGLKFIGVPTLPAPEAVRAAIETAWLEARPVRVVGVDKDRVGYDQVVRVEGLLMERHVARVLCVELGKTEVHALRLDRIKTAELIE